MGGGFGREHSMGGAFAEPLASTKAGCEMIIFDQDRASDSPFVERVWRCLSQGAAPFLSIAASRCELVVNSRSRLFLPPLLALIRLWSR